MPDILNVAENADIIVNGYAFTKNVNTIQVLNLNKPDRASVLSAKGDIIETSMDDIEISIVQEYFLRNQKYLEEE